MREKERVFKPYISLFNNLMLVSMVLRIETGLINSILRLPTFSINGDSMLKSDKFQLNFIQKEVSNESNVPE